MKPMSYKKRIKMRVNVSLFMCILALLLAAASFILKDKSAAFLSLMPSYTGTVAGMLGASLAVFFKNKALLKNPDELSNKELIEMDERNILISRQTFSLFASLSIGVLFVVMLIAGFFSPPLYYTLSAIICFDLLLIFCLRLYVRKLY